MVLSFSMGFSSQAQYFQNKSVSASGFSGYYRITKNVVPGKDKVFVNDLFLLFNQQTQHYVSITMFSKTLARLFPSIKSSVSRNNGERRRAYHGLSLVQHEQQKCVRTLEDLESFVPSEWRHQVTNGVLAVTIPTTWLCNGKLVMKDIKVHQDGLITCSIGDRTANLEAVGIQGNIALTDSHLVGTLKAIQALQVCCGSDSNSESAQQWSVSGDENHITTSQHIKSCHGLVKITSKTGTACDRCLRLVVANLPSASHTAQNTPSVHDKLEELTSLLGELGLPKDLSHLLVEQADNATQDNHRRRRWSPRYIICFLLAALDFIPFTLLFDNKLLFNLCHRSMLSIFRVKKANVHSKTLRNQLDVSTNIQYL